VGFGLGSVVGFSLGCNEVLITVGSKEGLVDGVSLGVAVVGEEEIDGDKDGGRETLG
jgi:hypothetical protein